MPLSHTLSGTPQGHSLNKMLHTALILSEIAHFVVHLQVLLGIGNLYNAKQYRRKQWYFVADAASVAMAWNLIEPTTYDTVLALCHYVLHVVYVLKWKNPDSFIVNSIIRWSAEKSHRSRIARDGWKMYAYNTLGTAFDIFVHGYMIYRLWTRQMFSTSNSSSSSN